MHYFDDQTHGKLLVLEKRILINVHKPRVERFYTILHELGHYIIHHLNPPRDYSPGYMRHKWQRDSINKFFKKVRRYLHFIFQCSAGKEWEADLWALCAFWLLAKQSGDKMDLRIFLSNHPEKLQLFALVRIVSGYQSVKKRWNVLICQVKSAFKAVHV